MANNETNYSPFTKPNDAPPRDSTIYSPKQIDREYAGTRSVLTHEIERYFRSKVMDRVRQMEKANNVPLGTSSPPYLFNAAHYVRSHVGWYKAKTGSIFLGLTEKGKSEWAERYGRQTKEQVNQFDFAHKGEMSHVDLGKKYGLSRSYVADEIDDLIANLKHDMVHQAGLSEASAYKIISTELFPTRRSHANTDLFRYTTEVGEYLWRLNRAGRKPKNNEFGTQSLSKLFVASPTNVRKETTEYLKQKQEEQRQLHGDEAAAYIHVDKTFGAFCSLNNQRFSPHLSLAGVEEWAEHYGRKVRDPKAYQSWKEHILNSQDKATKERS